MIKVREKAQSFDPRQVMEGDTYEVFHYLDMQARHLDAHYHDFYEMFYFVDGEVDYWVDGSVYHLKSGDILLINPLEMHKPIPRDDSTKYQRIVLWVNKEYLLGIDNGVFKTCFDKSLPTYKKILRPDTAQNSELISLFSNLIREYNGDNFASDSCAFGVLLQILALVNRIALNNNLSSESYRTSTLISEVLAYINEHYTEDLSLEGVAKHFFVSKYHLSHEFGKAVGTGMYRYLMIKRLNVAHDMLSNGTPPNQVATLCGFKDYTVFYKAFKGEYGISPKECGK